MTFAISPLPRLHGVLYFQVIFPSKTYFRLYQYSHKKYILTQQLMFSNVISPLILSIESEFGCWRSPRRTHCKSCCRILSRCRVNKIQRTKEKQFWDEKAAPSHISFFLFYSLELQSHSSAIYESEESYKSKFCSEIIFSCFVGVKFYGFVRRSCTC